MKYPKANRVLALVLALAMLLSGLPFTVLAEEGGGRFCLVVEAEGRLVIAPQYVDYAAGDTVKQALAASEHTFTGLEGGMVNIIDGVYGGYTRSDQNGGADLGAAASAVTHYRFSENSNSQPSEGLCVLMTAMADYLEEDADVRAAAEEAYEEACLRFVGAGDTEARDLAQNLTDAVTAYKAAQETTHTVTFAIADAAVFSVENAYGKQFSTENGIFSLPAGDYTFLVSGDNGCHVSGGLSVEGDMTVSAALPGDTEWLNTDAFCLSGAYGDDFDGSAFHMEAWSGRETRVYVPDSFTGTVYSYAEHTLEEGAAQLTAVYENRDGEASEEALAFRSKKSGAQQVLDTGSRGNRVVYRVSTVGDDGFAYSMDYTVELCRIPSLKSLSVTDPGKNAAQAATEAFSAYQTTYTYKIVDTVTQLTVKPVPYKSTYEVSVNGQEASQGVTVDLEADGNTQITVTVTGNGFTTTYTLTVLSGEGRSVTFKTTTADVTVTVVNNNGETLPYTMYKGTDSYNRYLYTLVPGETYSYVANTGPYYTAGKFTMEQSANSTITVDVPQEDWLTGLALGVSESVSDKGSYVLEDGFSGEKHAYRVAVPDTQSTMYLWADCADDLTVKAIYNQIASASLYHGVEKTVEIVQGQKKGIQLQRVLLSQNPYGNTVILRLSKSGADADGDANITYYQDYVLTVERTLSLESLSAGCRGTALLLTREEGTGYLPEVTDYTVHVPVAAETLELTPGCYRRQTVGGSWNTCYGEETTGYYTLVEHNGQPVEGSGTYTLALSQTSETETVTVTLCNEKVPGSSTVYTLSVQKDAPIYTTFVRNPESALLTLYEQVSGNRLWPNGDGAYELSEGYTYLYTLALKGYVGQSGTVSAVRDDQGSLVLDLGDRTIPVTFGEDSQSGTAQISLSLEAAPENTQIDSTIPAQWPDFRGDSSNNAVTDVPIPITSETGTLYWANKLGDGVDSGAVGSPIIVDGDLITYAGDQIFRVDTLSGEILEQNTMAGRSSFAITPPVYADGMIIVALSKGTVQAFDAKTLDSLWVYHDPLEGQPNTPVTVKDGYVYTGFWVSEVADANFVCLTVTDEDPTNPSEEKVAVWKHTQAGGFYWAGAYVTDGYLLVGTDDGTAGNTAQTSVLLMMDPLTGKVLDRWEGLNGDIRSSVCYDAGTGACYFTSKGGTFYSVKVTGEQDGLRLTGKWTVALQNGTGKTPMSTSTPVVHNGRAYVGVSGQAQFDQYGGHNITVIDLERHAIAYRAQTQGYPQTSGLLTTAYEADTGYVYIYFFDNYTPGKLRVLRDTAGQKAADYCTAEKGYDTPYVLFAPMGDHAQYAICSPITDAFGTVYFKNDSAHLMAFGPAVEKLEVTKQPSKTIYAAGESFDKTGMTVIATYTNGMTRDVTDYVTASEILAGDTVVTLTYPHVLYHNQDGADSISQGGITSVKPTVTIAITVQGEITAATAIRSVTVSGDQLTVTLNGLAKTGWQLMAAAYDGSGKLQAVSLKEAQASVTQTLMLTGAAGADAAVRVFLLDENFVPVASAFPVSK